jgi:hypothetical protein
VATRGPEGTPKGFILDQCLLRSFNNSDIAKWWLISLLMCMLGISMML